MFMGQYNQKVDTKGRAIVPAKLREGLGDQFVIAKGIEKCLYGFAMSDWERITAKMNEMSIADPQAQKFIRFFLAGASLLEFDKQGRALIPAQLREYALLEKDVVWVGVGNKIEVWNPDEFDKSIDFSPDELQEIAQHMAGLGL